MESKRGRPRKTNVEELEKLLLEYKDEIYDGMKVISKDAPIWRTLSLLCDKDPRALYTFVTCNHYNIKETLSITTKVSILCNSFEHK